jgi:hypothetical protein
MALLFDGMRCTHVVALTVLVRVKAFGGLHMAPTTTLHRFICSKKNAQRPAPLGQHESIACARPDEMDPIYCLPMFRGFGMFLGDGHTHQRGFMDLSFPIYSLDK